MKKKAFLTAMFFVFAAACAFATIRFSPQDGHTKKSDWPGQERDCQFRCVCDGEGGLCTINSPIGTASLYDSECVNALYGLCQ